MKLSYLVTCSKETDSLRKLLDVLTEYCDPVDEINVVIDSDIPSNKNKKTRDIVESYFQRSPAIVHPFEHPLDKNYGGHKNWGNEQCSGEYIFQLDGDEIPTPTLIANIKVIIEANPGVELIFVPRINDFIGVNHDNAKKWGWRLTPCPVYENRLIVNWPDYQSRIYKNVPDRIRWDRRLHEKIEGYTSMATLPEDYDLALYHDKTMETQEQTNLRYNEWFTQEENRGHNVFDKKK